MGEFSFERFNCWNGNHIKCKVMCAHASASKQRRPLCEHTLISSKRRRARRPQAKSSTEDERAIKLPFFECIPVQPTSCSRNDSRLMIEVMSTRGGIFICCYQRSTGLGPRLLWKLHSKLIARKRETVKFLMHYH